MEPQRGTSRREIRSIEIGSVVRVVFALSASLWGILLVGSVALYLLGLVSGGLGGVEGFVASLGFSGFQFTILPFILGLVLIAALASAVVALLAGVLALVYNRVQPLMGGIVVHDRDR